MRFTILFILAALASGCGHQSVEFSLVSPAAIRKGEIVETRIADLGFKEGAQLVVFADGVEVPSQLTFDGKLLFAADADAAYVVKRGTPSTPYTVYACGAQYPERVDDIAWESDLAAFRIYGPALQRSGERAFGNDLWLKNNTDLPVVDYRYRTELNPETRARIRELKKSDKKAAKRLADSVSYHIDHGNGFDPYSVGPTLGAGGTAVFADGAIVYPYCYTEYKILDNGPLRFTVEVAYAPTEIDGAILTEHRIISIDKGSFLNRTQVWYEGASKAIEVVSGIVIHHQGDATSFCEEFHTIGNIDPIKGDKAEVGEIYVGMVFPDGWAKAYELPCTPEERQSMNASHAAAGHAAAFNTLAPDERLTYYWGGAWSRATVRPMPSFEEWNAYLVEVAERTADPIQIKIK